jgi:protein TonB
MNRPLLVYCVAASVLAHGFLATLWSGHPRRPQSIPVEIGFVRVNGAPAPAATPRPRRVFSSVRRVPIVGPQASSPIAAASLAPVPTGTVPGTGHSAVAAAAFQSALWAAIENVKEYPPAARSRHQTGRVRVGFTLKKDGGITAIHLSEPSEYDLLNEAALDTLRRLGQFKPIPDEVAAGDLNLIVPINFRMRD